MALVAIGIGLSLAWLVYVTTQPRLPELGREPDTKLFRDVDEDPGYETYPTVAVIRLDGGLFFATSEALEIRIRGLVDDERPLTAIVLDFEGVNFIDSQGAAKLAEMHRFLEGEGITLLLARVKPTVMTVLQADGIDSVMADHIHHNIHGAVETQLPNAR